MKKKIIPISQSKKDEEKSTTNLSDKEKFLLEKFKDFDLGFDEYKDFFSFSDLDKKLDLLKNDEKWLDNEFEGQLSVDVYQTKDDIIVKSTMAGVKPEDLEISLEGDMLTIRGKRSHEEKVEDKDYFYRECYWGGFSRSIILPVDVQADKVKAVLNNGVLTITLPKANKTTKIKVEEAS